MSELLVFVVIALATALAFTVLKALTLWYAIQHTTKAPKGSFKLTMPASQWDKQVAQGALAIAITDAQGHVYMTLLVQRGPRYEKLKNEGTHYRTKRCSAGELEADGMEVEK